MIHSEIKGFLMRSAQERMLADLDLVQPGHTGQELKPFCLALFATIPVNEFGSGLRTQEIFR
jgi:hypothetical protein